MKILKIENKEGFYLNDKGTYCPIKEITKEDIYNLILRIIDENNAFTLDELSETLVINNPADVIIYERLSLKFKELITNKLSIIESINEKFIKLENEYNLNNLNT